MCGIDRKQAAEHHRHGGPEARQGLVDRLAVVGDGVADAGVGHFLDRGGEHADLAGAKLVHQRELGREYAGAIDIIGGVRAHHADALALLQHAVDDAHQHDHAEIDVVPAVDQQRLQRGVAVAFRRRQARDDRLQHLRHIQSSLRGNLDGVRCIEPDHVLDLLLDLGGLGRRQIDFIEHGHDLVAVVDRLVDVRQRLRFDALAGVDDKERAFARGKRPVDLVGKVDVAGRVDQVQYVVIAVARLVFEADGLRLDGNAALALDIHGIEHLLLHLALFQPAGELNQPVGKRGLAVVDMRNDREVADILDWGGGHGAQITPG